MEIGAHSVVNVSKFTKLRHPVPQPHIMGVEYVRTIHMVEHSINLHIVGISRDMVALVNYKYGCPGIFCRVSECAPKKSCANNDEVILRHPSSLAWSYGSRSLFEFVAQKMREENCPIRT